MYLIASDGGNSRGSEQHIFETEAFDILLNCFEGVKVLSNNNLRNCIKINVQTHKADDHAVYQLFFLLKRTIQYG